MKRLVWALLALQLLVFAFFLMHLGDTTGHATARGGHSTQISLEPYTPWTGMHGRLTTTGETIVTLTQQQIIQRHVYFDNPQNECKRTELFAATTPVSAQDITPVTPQQADALLGFVSGHAYSATSMFTTQETYDLAGTPVMLWSTTTNGALTSFTQGIGQVNGTLVFVTKTVRNGRAYNNEPADYQFLLPAGQWHVTYDETDECTVLDEFEESTLTPADAKLDVSVETRICVGEETRFAAVFMRERTLCRPHEWGNVYCTVASDATLGIRKDTQTVTALAENGVVFFSPSEPGQYTLSAQTQNQTATRIISAQHCLGYGVQEPDARTITYDRPVVEIGQFPHRAPREETPAQLDEQTIAAAYSLIATLTIMIVLLSLFAYFHVAEKAVFASLRVRIWLLEHFRK